VRDAFKHHGKHKITSRAARLDLFSGELSEIVPDLANDDRGFIEKIFEAYGGYGPWELRDLTHEPGSPWDQLWNSDTIRARFGMRIRNEEILAHFSLKGTRSRI
jgi:uncharacterized phage-associated protein